MPKTRTTLLLPALLLATAAQAQNYLLDNSGGKLLDDAGSPLLAQAVEPPPPAPQPELSQILMDKVNARSVHAIASYYRRDGFYTIMVHVIADPAAPPLASIGVRVNFVTRIAFCQRADTCTVRWPRAQMSTNQNDVAIELAFASGPAYKTSFKLPPRPPL
jgi:hypothetical protein